MQPQPIQSVAVSAPSRLHFGMFSFGRPDVRQFGGVGTMIQSPGVRLTICSADRFQVTGAHARRAREFVDIVLSNLAREHGWLGKVSVAEACELRAEIKVEHAPREHVGLGLGTQLGLAIAAGLCAALNLPKRAAAELARLSDRGVRSAIGTHGFERGGLLIEAGKRAEDEISPLVARLELPQAWRFVLFCPKSATGLSGESERAAFDALPPVPLEITRQLACEVLFELLPAAMAVDFAAFGRSLHSFNRTAGLCFAARQGGPFAAGITKEVVDCLRREGFEGTGQTSWGPTVFALCRDSIEAAECSQTVEQKVQTFDGDIIISPLCNRGAQVELL